MILRVTKLSRRRQILRAFSSDTRINADDCRLQLLADQIRRHGHLRARINPFENVKTTLHTASAEKITPEEFGLPRNGLLEYGEQTGTIDEWYKRMLATYTGHVGVEFMHLERERRDWFIRMLERESFLSAKPLQPFQKQVCKALLESQTFDQFVATKFATTKRYGGEGAESMNAFFLQLFLQAPICGITDIVIGSPHRGRLNLLTGLLQFPAETVFRKMRGLPEYETSKFPKASGDVLSHLFTSVSLQSDLRVSLLPNPSHLEAISPVVVGKARARLQQLLGNNSYSQVCDAPRHTNPWVLAVQVHGDASFAGQGVVMETLLLSRLPHFKTGGSLHLIVNNQVGYTTPTALGKSSRYNSDTMKAVDAPVLHVNGDHPEAVCVATQLALNYRQHFGEDILVDMWCFRRWGHNEMDDPTFTNPIMYREIHARQSVPDMYAQKLQDEGVLSKDEVTAIVLEHNARLAESLAKADSYESRSQTLKGRWKNIVPAPLEGLMRFDTGLPIELLQYIGLKSTEVPPNFAVHPHLQKVVIAERAKRFTEGKRFDWAMAELLSFGSLLYQGYNVRISGQDVGRGTFSHRHAMLFDNETEERLITLNSLRPDQGQLEVVNSPLSEEAVMSFEYGFSLESPNNLVIWEAQFGDFHNSAQVVLDTLVTSGERKWLLQSGIVILLPHGFDGAGSEHSSSRIERFLQICDSNEKGVPDSEDVNFRFANPTTAAQYFHLIRRQMLPNFRKPLIVASPKTILRLPEASSTLADMAPGTSFQPVLGAIDCVDPKSVKKVVLVSGKHYFTLEAKRRELSRNDIAIIRLEQLCPFPVADLADALRPFRHVKNFVWAQEEGRNMGPWTFVATRIKNFLNIEMSYCGRESLGTPATGVGEKHKAEAAAIVDSIFMDSGK
ncbi:probable 2-oxoglutarate dehydrogenase E1 component DHKTD1, mitochondrial isoform X1 [Varroa jacobsoni]|uniref:probable 2-oxoglutarate dehydrogenase E1 component DHKTD1, mitochondrial isoform X1 n=2 Tax=Varroa jacobsoni TaxID=62625 RepID=UPI000BF31664|nr:probable 2-oxoglutarate dehydrogenase E1 component DHKTD1, mitochondrial isoform X1 [Varroa jacobsoni]